MTDRPTIAVVIPAYNLARYLPEAIEGVLAQTIDPSRLEILVIDDGSTDETPVVASRYAPRVRCISQPNRGLPAARNRGLAETTAPHVTFLDADDRILPEKLATEIAVFEADPGAGLVYSGWRYIDADGDPLPQRGWSREEGDVLGRLLLGNLIHPHAALVRRSLVEAVGAFDESLTSVEDWDLWLRITMAGARWRCVDQPLLEYRVRSDGMHANPKRMLRNRVAVLDKTFAQLEGASDLVRTRPRAYQNAYLEAACDYAGMDAMEDALSTMTTATAYHPSFLTDVRTLRELSRLLLPLGFRNESQVVARWPAIAPRFTQLVHAGIRTLPPRDRAKGEIARFRVAARYRRKRLLGARDSRPSQLATGV
jgi:GT2 family glycosyltransferase